MMKWLCGRYLQCEWEYKSSQPDSKYYKTPDGTPKESPLASTDAEARPRAGGRPKSTKVSPLFHREVMPIISCCVPAQANSFDCGMFVAMFATKLLELWPTSTERNIKDQFKTLIHPEWFTQKDIDSERSVLQARLQEYVFYDPSPPEYL
jgi:hypothetical protein